MPAVRQEAGREPQAARVMHMARWRRGGGWMDGAGEPAPAARAKMFSACRCLPYRSNPCASPHTAGGMPMIVRKGAKPAVRFHRQIRGVRRAGSNHGQGTGTESRLWSERNKNKVAATVKSGTCGWAAGPEPKRDRLGGTPRAKRRAVGGSAVGRNAQSKGRAVGPQAQSEKASGWAERPEQRESGWAAGPEREGQRLGGTPRAKKERGWAQCPER